MNICPVDELRSLFLDRGSARYADSVRHVDHALRCATLAEREGAPAWLVTAALTHDIGHLLISEDNRDEASIDDDRHEQVGADWLTSRFDSRVAQLVGAHVAAKRYLCATEPGYMRSLPLACQRTLALQGGPMCSAEIERFNAYAHAAEALRLRRWDEKSQFTLDESSRLEHFLSIARLALPRPRFA